MIGDLFDSPWKVLIVAVVLIVLFGSKKLPDAARSLGKSMRILKTEVGSLHEDETTSRASTASGAPAAFPPAAEIAASQPVPPAPQPVRQPDQSQAQIDALQQQIRDLQRAATMDPVPVPVTQAGAASEPQRSQQSS
ncbi:MAG TPA: Sec-independent protein translocase subunit TatA [Streptosporangiaceae bacterium]|jgi:sec-independent protein translocase protein TatA|nr:Sec-independent protein translocase subunit TatA [Streptosporangiaceae bacterium]